MHDDDLDRELRDHLDLEAEELRAAGSSPREAIHAARRTLGNTTLLKEAIREVGGWTSLERFTQDLRYGLRLLRRSPGFSIVAILTLALGIGANTAIFSVVNAFLLRPLPFADSSRLMRVWPTNGSITSYPNFLDWKTQNRSFERMEVYVPRSFNITGGDRPQHVQGLRTSGGLLQLLQVNPIHGRTFVPDEIQPGGDHVVLLSEGLWQNRFARDPGVLGKTVKLNDEVFTVIGILPSTFQFPPDHPTDIVLPQPPDPDRGHGFLNVVGRLKPGVTLAQAQVEMDTIAKQQELLYPKQNQKAGVRVLSLRDSYAVNFRPALLIFLSAVGFVLLIACANVANLFLARTAGRHKELVLRAALGAGRVRLIRQLITESALLGLAGGAAGLAIAYWGVLGLVTLVRSTFATHALDTASIDGTVLAFTLLLSLAVGMVAGLAPAFGASRLDVNDTLKEGSRGLTGNRRRNRMRATLEVAEIALALVLLIGAGLMIKTFVLLNSVDAGIHPENVLTLNLAIGGKKYAETQARAPFVSEVLHRVEQLSGVQSAAVVTDIPLSGDIDAEGFSIEGRQDPAPDRKLSWNVNIVGPGYLRTLGIPLLKGRDFTERDSASTPLVALINQSLARKYWPSQDPIGARISSDKKTWATIRGVVGDVRQGGLGAEPVPEVYLSYLQDPFAWPYLTMLVHTSVDPMKLVASIQSAIWSVEKDLPITSIKTMEQIRSHSIAQPRLTALLLSVFAALALILAAVGIYGVMAYSVTQRTHEMGLRMALGARASDVLALVVGQGMLLAGAGIVLGLAGAFAMTRVLEKFLWGVRPTDTFTFIVVSLLLVAVALLASYLPARRATRVDPMVALRYE
ncbi:MAG: ABC transporter permease [Bryobacteraceae bacterium]